MGLFNGGNNNKTSIKNSILKLSTGMVQIENDMKMFNNQVSPLVYGIIEALAEEIKVIHSLLKPNGRTDWNTLNTLIVKEHGGKEVLLSDFINRYNNKAKGIYFMTKIDIQIWT